MKVLDLFCGAGGAAAGIKRALPDAEITGVDINPQPNYPFTFVQADAMTFPLEGYDFIWASPPCQRYSVGTQRWPDRVAQYPDLVEPVRRKLIASGAAYVIENVEHAPMAGAIKLCGEMFGLEIIRHRLFESSFSVEQPQHIKHRGKVHDGFYVTVAGHGGHGSNAYGRWASVMGIDWMTKKELAQAVPPAYSHYVCSAPTLLTRLGNRDTIKHAQT